MSKKNNNTTKSVTRKVHRGEILGYSITAMIRGLSANDFTTEETEAVLRAYGHGKTSKATIATQRSWGRHAEENGMTMPELSRKEIKQLKAAAKEQMA